MGGDGTCVDFEDSSLRPSEMRLTPEPGKTLHVGPLQLRKPLLHPQHPRKVLHPSAHDYPDSGHRRLSQ